MCCRDSETAQWWQRYTPTHQAVPDKTSRLYRQQHLPLHPAVAGAAVMSERLPVHRNQAGHTAVHNGFTSAAQNGAEAVVLFPGGGRSHGVAVVVADRRFRLKGLARGEVALYDDQGQSVTLTRAGIVVNGGGKPVIFTNATKARFEMPIESTGDIRDNCDSSGKTMAEMRTTYNGHTHKENGDGGGITDKPGQPMS